MSLNGRNEHGFIPGSQAARDFEAAVRREEFKRSPYKSKAMPEEKLVALRLKRRQERLRNYLLEPDWWNCIAHHTVSIQRNKRYYARVNAKLAAQELQVPIPEWAKTEKREATTEDRERIREVSLRRYELP